MVIMVITNQMIIIYLVFMKYANAVQIGRQCNSLHFRQDFFLILQVSFGKILILIVNLVCEL